MERKGSNAEVGRSESRERREKKEKKESKEKKEKEKKEKGSRHSTPSVVSPGSDRKERRGSRRERESSGGAEVRDAYIAAIALLTDEGSPHPSCAAASSTSEGHVDAFELSAHAASFICYSLTRRRNYWRDQTT